ncbi:DLEC1 cilia and flagella associated protein [Phyllostomus discolor]|uniref:DLEC1 cilia and flagella associated protein n=1 Tax=Phyllostomus discolor TaxID=89673 RepID=A0A833ZUP6_9CHIR|nr:DLEC1 cilia and flagella associated protein [Phyllostomus discolor]
MPVAGRLSVEVDYGGGTEFRHQASDLIPEEPCSGVLSELVTTHHLKLTNTMDIPHYFQLMVSRPFSVSQEGASRSHRTPGPGQEPAAAGKQLVLHPHKSMLVDVSFSLSLELLSYQRLPADQMLPGVVIQQSESGEKEMVFTQDLLLEYANHTTQVVPLRATVAVPELQLSTSWVDFGSCFVNKEHVREVYLMNLSGSRSYWTVLMEAPGQWPCDLRGLPKQWTAGGATSQRASNLHRPAGALHGQVQPLPTSQALPTPGTVPQLRPLWPHRSNELYESTLVVEGVLGEKACTLRLRGQGSYDERFVSPYQL